MACGIMIGAAAATGVGRLVTEEHHLSDVLVGYGAGVIAGFIMPEFLHYRYAKPDLVATEPTAKSIVRATVLPAVGPHDLGVELRGSF